MLRPYQQESVDAVYKYLRLRNDNPCIVLPTGTGKSHVIAQIVSDAVQQWHGRVLILSHVKELLEQNAEKILIHAPGIPVGIYSAGLKRRDTDEPVIVAGIQSVYQRAGELGTFNLIIVDEAHLIPPDGDGMYQQFFADAKIVNPDVRIIGLTATPFRLKGGLLCGPNNILNDICYEAGLKEMIVQGYLSQLKSRNGKCSVPDLSEVRIIGGEFVVSEMAEAFDQDHLVRTACQEIVDLVQEYGRKSILVFAASVEHARHVKAWLERLSGEPVGLVTGETNASERAVTIRRFKGESVQADLFGEMLPPIKYLVNVRVFTTGFDATGVDCVVMLFGTASTGLYVQVVGRGTRLHPGKEYCLVLDYGGNIMRHGPVDCVSPRGKVAGKREGVSPTKECPECGSLMHTAYTVCPDCGYEFPKQAPSHGFTADGTPILSGEITEKTYAVSDVFYSVHTRKGADESIPKTLRVEYQVGANFISEWVCPEHTGWARQKFEAWWNARAAVPPPKTTKEAADLANDGYLARPISIQVRHVSGERFDRVIGYELEPKRDDEFPWERGAKETVAVVGANSNDDEEEEDIPF